MAAPQNLDVIDTDTLLSALISRSDWALIFDRLDLAAVRSGFLEWIGRVDDIYEFFRIDSPDDVTIDNFDDGVILDAADSIRSGNNQTIDRAAALNKDCRADQNAASREEILLGLDLVKPLEKIKQMLEAGDTDAAKQALSDFIRPRHRAPLTYSRVKPARAAEHAG